MESLRMNRDNLKENTKFNFKKSFKNERKCLKAGIKK